MSEGDITRIQPPQTEQHHAHAESIAARRGSDRESRDSEPVARGKGGRKGGKKGGPSGKGSAPKGGKGEIGGKGRQGTSTAESPADGEGRSDPAVPRSKGSGKGGKGGRDRDSRTPDGRDSEAASAANAEQVPASADSAVEAYRPPQFRDPHALPGSEGEHRRSAGPSGKKADGRKGGCRGRGESSRGRGKGGRGGKAERSTEDQAPGTAVEVEEADGSEERPLCVICAQPAYGVAFGDCKHREVCAECCLRSRMLFKDPKCPLCKQQQRRVVLCAATPAGLPAAPLPGPTAREEPFKALMALPETNDREVWARRSMKKDWGPGVFLVVPPSAGSAREGTAAERASVAGAAAWRRGLEQLASMQCPLCLREGAGGAGGLRSMHALQQHVRSHHRRSLCPLCSAHRPCFPVEQETYAPEALAGHIAEAHPQCQFCEERYYSTDDLYKHMREAHFPCQVCERMGLPHQYYSDYRALKEHFWTNHFPCQERCCIDQRFVVFCSEDELRQHQREVHSAHMPRFDPRAARRLDLPFRPAASDAHARPGPARDHPPPRHQPSSGRAQEADAGPPGFDDMFPQLGAEEPAEDGGGIHWRVIDDDLGRARERHEAATGRRLHPRAGGAARGAEPVEHFPALPPAAAPARPPPAPSSSAPAASGSQAAPGVARALATVQLACPCGLRTSVVPAPPPGAPPLPAPACDEACARARRRRQLADAFGMGDSSSVASDQAVSMFSPELLRAAVEAPAWVRQVEGSLGDMLVAGAPKRCSLAPMPAPQRQLVHALAALYSISTYSYGTEPKRHVDLFRLPTSTLPVVLLSQVASTSAAKRVLEQQEQQLAASRQSLVGTALGAAPEIEERLHFTDLRAGLEVDDLVRAHAEGQFSSRPAPAHQGGGVYVHFASERGLQRTREALGGGVRGEFRLRLEPNPCYAAPPQPTPAADAPDADTAPDAASTSAAQPGHPHRTRSSAAHSGGRGAPAEAPGSWRGSAGGGAGGGDPEGDWISTQSRGKRGAGQGARGGSGAAAPAEARVVRDAWDDELRQVGPGAGMVGGTARGEDVAEDWETLAEGPAGGGSVANVNLPGVAAPLELSTNAWDVLLEEED